MVDNRLFALQLVQSGLTPATLFLANGQVAQAADVLYKRPIVLMRGSFNPVCNLHLEVMAQVKKTFLSHINETQADRCMEICEISMNNLLRGDDVDHLEFLDRADSLKALGKNVLITKMARFDNLSGLLARYTREPIAIALSIGLLNELFKENGRRTFPEAFWNPSDAPSRTKRACTSPRGSTANPGNSSRHALSARRNNTCTCTSTSWRTAWWWTCPFQ